MTIGVALMASGLSTNAADVHGMTTKKNRPPCPITRTTQDDDDAQSVPALICTFMNRYSVKAPSQRGRIGEQPGGSNMDNNATEIQQNSFEHLSRASYA